jgi:hypothetical protein
VTTDPDMLLDLPPGSIVIDCDHDVWFVRDDGWYLGDGTEPEMTPAAVVRGYGPFLVARVGPAEHPSDHPADQ